MLFVIYFMIFGMKIGMCLAHVYCQDEHATDWSELGYSCPINCPAIIAAVKRLKLIDYEELISVHQSPFSVNVLNATKHHFEDSEERNPEDPLLIVDTDDENSEKPETSMRKTNEIEKDELTASHYVQLYKLLLDKSTRNELATALQLAARQARSESCRLFQKGRDNRYMVKTRCNDSRRAAIQKDFLSQFTNVLNKHTATDYFTTRSTEALLQKLLGDDASIRLGILDVNKLLKILSRAVSKHKQHARAASRTITLRAQYCLNVYVPGCFCIPGNISRVGRKRPVHPGDRTITLKGKACTFTRVPGCFCKPGYVELNGQCVRPHDCYSDPSPVREYLARITVI